ncbi:MAG: class I SAM-dependent methyltransferase [Elusimicrobia bacterium]|nr:class I SAM-dependent methyltransferase [Elusimicrobiota bacterium]
MTPSGGRLRETEPLRRLYARASRYYDLLDWPFEFFRYRALRRNLWKGLGGKILDLGAGTGRNAPYYPPDADVITADLSPEMLERARERIEATGRKAHIVVADALSLNFKDGEFDACVSTFLFCVLPDELQERALREIKRVLKPAGKVYLLEYVYSRNPRRRLWMRILSPWVERLYGARFDRRTQEHCVMAGYEVIERRFVHSDMVLKLVGRPRTEQGSMDRPQPPH